MRTGRSSAPRRVPAPRVHGGLLAAAAAPRAWAGAACCGGRSGRPGRLGRRGPGDRRDPAAARRGWDGHPVGDPRRPDDGSPWNDRRPTACWRTSPHPRPPPRSSARRSSVATASPLASPLAPSPVAASLVATAASRDGDVDASPFPDRSPFDEASTIASIRPALRRRWDPSIPIVCAICCSSGRSFPSNVLRSMVFIGALPLFLAFARAVRPGAFASRRGSAPVRSRSVGASRAS